MGCSCVGWMIENRGLSVLCVYILAGTHEAQRSRGARDGRNKQSYPRSSRASDRDESRDLSRQLGWFFVPQSSKLRYLFISRLLCANNMISSLRTRQRISIRFKPLLRPDRNLVRAIERIQTRPATSREQNLGDRGVAFGHCSKRCVR
jgi:hypothetical protein